VKSSFFLYLEVLNFSTSGCYKQAEFIPNVNLLSEEFGGGNLYVFCCIMDWSCQVPWTET
jgi:hypothetical protein